MRVYRSKYRNCFSSRPNSRGKRTPCVSPACTICAARRDEKEARAPSSARLAARASGGRCAAPPRQPHVLVHKAPQLRHCAAVVCLVLGCSCWLYVQLQSLWQAPCRDATLHTPAAWVCFGKLLAGRRLVHAGQLHAGRAALPIMRSAGGSHLEHKLVELCAVGQGGGRDRSPAGPSGHAEVSVHSLQAAHDALQVARQRLRAHTRLTHGSSTTWSCWPGLRSGAALRPSRIQGRRASPAFEPLKQRQGSLSSLGDRHDQAGPVGTCNAEAGPAPHWHWRRKSTTCRGRAASWRALPC